MKGTDRSNDKLRDRIEELKHLKQVVEEREKAMKDIRGQLKEAKSQTRWKDEENVKLNQSVLRLGAHLKELKETRGTTDAELHFREEKYTEAAMELELARAKLEKKKKKK